MREQSDGARDCLGLERDVVVHEDHVRAPALLTELHQTAREAAGAAEVGVRHETERCAGGDLRRKIARVVHHEHLHVPGDLGNAGLEREQAVDRAQHVLLTVEGGDGHPQTHVTQYRG